DPGRAHIRRGGILDPREVPRAAARVLSSSRLRRHELRRLPRRGTASRHRRRERDAPEGAGRFGHLPRDHLAGDERGEVPDRVPAALRGGVGALHAVRHAARGDRGRMRAFGCRSRRGPFL
ncbi:MAG: hypothetical protein AVDCRST_MAG02-4906, partial [uncultured Rubrobacteraceae bacterium]